MRFDYESIETVVLPHEAPSEAEAIALWIPPGRLADAEPLTRQPWIVVATHDLRPPFDPRLVLLGDPDSPSANELRMLRHRLQRATMPRVVLVTSPGPGEGKTTCAVNLALALGEGRPGRVLLIDAAARAPSLAEIFQMMPPESFAAQLLRHRSDPAGPWDIVEISPSGLHVLALSPGHDAHLPPALFKEAVDQLRVAYDHIVVDAGSVLGTTDVNALDPAVDGIILATRRTRSRMPLIARAVEQLTPDRVLGVVLLDA